MTIGGGPPDGSSAAAGTATSKARMAAKQPGVDAKRPGTHGSDIKAVGTVEPPPWVQHPACLGQPCEITRPSCRPVNGAPRRFVSPGLGSLAARAFRARG